MLPGAGIRERLAFAIESIVRREAAEVPLLLFWSMMRRAAGEVPVQLFDPMDRLTWQVRRAIELARVHASPRLPLEQRIADGDVIDTLLEYARQDNRNDFEWLARSTGIAADDVVALWEGTRRRLPRTTAVRADPSAA